MEATNKYSIHVGKDYRYYKIKAEGTDKWFFGKVNNRPIPKGAIAMSFKDWLEAIIGGEQTKKQMKRAFLAEHTAGELTIETARNIDHLPNPNDDENFKNIINKSKEFTI